MASNNYYEILNLKPDVGPEDLKKTYEKKLKSRVTNEEYSAIKKAFETLISPEERTRYDRQLGLVAPGGQPSWIKHYHNYANQQLQEDRAFAEQVKPVIKQPTDILPGLLLVIFLGVLVFCYFQRNELVAGFAAIYKPPTAVLPTAAKVDYPDIVKLFPSHAVMLADKGDPCRKAVQEYLQSDLQFGIFYAGRFNCPQIALTILKQGPDIKTVQWNSITYDAKKFAKIFGSGQVVRLIDDYQQGRLTDLRGVIGKENPYDVDKDKITAIQAEIKALEKSIHFTKAEGLCTRVEAAVSGKELLENYQNYLLCLQTEIQKQRDYRKTKGHTQIPE